MKNPYEIAMVVAGIILAITGALLIGGGVSASQDIYAESGDGLGLIVAGSSTIGLGVLFLLGWLVVAGINWRPKVPNQH